MNEIRNHEIELTDYALGKLTSEFGETISILAPKRNRAWGRNFTFDGAHPMTFRKFLSRKYMCAGHIVQNR